MSWQGEPLPRGRHKLSREVVELSQRGRLVRAMVELVAERGYAATTVPEVVAKARVSRNAFYKHFADKTDCFIAVANDVNRELLDGLYAFAGESTWLDALRKGMDFYLGYWAERPAFSRTYFLELPAAGERALAQREEAYVEWRALFEALAARARAEQPGAAAALAARRARGRGDGHRAGRRGGPRGPDRASCASCATSSSR